MAPFALRLRPAVTRPPLSLRARVPAERSGRRPGHGSVAAGAPQVQDASSGRLGGLRASSGAEPRLLWAPGVRPGPAATTPGGRGRLGVGTGRGRGSSSPFRRPSSRLPRPLFPGRPARPPAGPFTFKQSYEVAVAAATGAQWGPGRRALPPARPRLEGPGAGRAPRARPAGHTPARPDSGPVRPGTLQRPRTGRVGQGLASPRDGGDGGGGQARARLSVSTERSQAGWRGTPGTTRPLTPPQSWKGRGRPPFPSIFILSSF